MNSGLEIKNPTQNGYPLYFIFLTTKFITNQVTA